MKNLITTIFATAALLVANNAWAEDIEKTTSHNFEDGNAVFTADSRITVAIEEDESLESKVVGFTSAGNTGNGYAFAHYDFSSLIDKAYKVKIAFDFYNTNGARSILSIGDNSVRGTTGQSSKNTYSSDGVIFQIGSDKNYSFINGTNHTITDLTGLWMNVQVIVNVTDKKVDYTITNKSNGATIYSGSQVDYYNDNVTTCSQIDVWDGLINSAHMMMIDNLSITTYVDNSASYADYSVKYVCNNEEIKEAATRNAQVNSAIELTTADKTAFNSADNSKRYIYISDDSAEKTVSADGSTIVTISFREAETNTVTVNSSCGTTIATLSGFEDLSETIYLSKYILSDGKLYSVDGNVYNYDVTFEESKSVEITYTEVYSDIYAYYEAEDIFTDNVGKGLPARSSGGAIANISEGVLFSLPKGEYIITIAGMGFSTSVPSVAYTVKAGETTIIEGDVTSNFTTEFTSNTITLTEPTDISFTCASPSSMRGLDYVYVRKVGDITTTYTIKYVNELGSELDCIDNIVTEINIGEEFTATEAQMAEIVDSESELTYVYKSGNETKTAVADAAENVITLVYELKVEPQDPGTVTSVGSVKANAADGDIYTLGGVKVVNPTPGLYIQNGKLVRVK